MKYIIELLNSLTWGTQSDRVTVKQLEVDKAELLGALSRCRGQWIHSVNAEKNLALIAKHTQEAA